MMAAHMFNFLWLDLNAGFSGLPLIVEFKWSVPSLGTENTFAVMAKGHIALEKPYSCTHGINYGYAYKCGYESCDLCQSLQFTRVEGFPSSCF